MKIIWVESIDLSAGAGRGVDFFVGDDREHDLVAVIHGFEWLHRSPETVEIMIRPPDAEYSEAFLADARSSIERWVNHPEMFWAHTDPSPMVRAIVNG